MRVCLQLTALVLIVFGVGCSRDTLWASGKDVKREIGVREQALRQEMTRKLDLLEREQLQAKARASDIQIQILQDQLAGRTTDEKLKSELKEVNAAQDAIGKDITRIRNDLDTVNQVVADMKAEMAAGKEREGEHSQQEIDRLKRFEQLERQYSGGR